MVRNKERINSGKRLKPATWQMNCHALTNCPAIILSRSVVTTRVCKESLPIWRLTMYSNMHSTCTLSQYTVEYSTRQSYYAHASLCDNFIHYFNL